MVEAEVPVLRETGPGPQRGVEEDDSLAGSSLSSSLPQEVWM